MTKKEFVESMRLLGESDKKIKKLIEYAEKCCGDDQKRLEEFYETTFENRNAHTLRF